MEVKKNGDGNEIAEEVGKEDEWGMGEEAHRLVIAEKEHENK